MKRNNQASKQKAIKQYAPAIILNGKHTLPISPYIFYQHCVKTKILPMDITVDRNTQFKRDLFGFQQYRLSCEEETCIHMMEYSKNKLSNVLARLNIFSGNNNKTQKYMLRTWRGDMTPKVTVFVVNNTVYDAESHQFINVADDESLSESFCAFYYTFYPWNQGTHCFPCCCRKMKCCCCRQGNDAAERQRRRQLEESCHCNKHYGDWESVCVTFVKQQDDDNNHSAIFIEQTLESDNEEDNVQFHPSKFIFRPHSVTPIIIDSKDLDYISNDDGLGCLRRPVIYASSGSNGLWPKSGVHPYGHLSKNAILESRYFKNQSRKSLEKDKINPDMNNIKNWFSKVKQYYEQSVSFLQNIGIWNHVQHHLLKNIPCMVDDTRVVSKQSILWPTWNSLDIVWQEELENDIPNYLLNLQCMHRMHCGNEIGVYVPIPEESPIDIIENHYMYNAGRSLFHTPPPSSSPSNTITSTTASAVEEEDSILKNLFMQRKLNNVDRYGNIVPPHMWLFLPKYWGNPPRKLCNCLSSSEEKVGELIASMSTDMLERVYQHIFSKSDGFTPEMREQLNTTTTQIVEVMNKIHVLEGGPRGFMQREPFHTIFLTAFQAKIVELTQQQRG